VSERKQIVGTPMKFSAYGRGPICPGFTGTVPALWGLKSSVPASRKKFGYGCQMCQNSVTGAKCARIRLWGAKCARIQLGGAKCARIRLGGAKCAKSSKT